MTLREGQTAFLEKYDARLEFLKKVSESRCPADVMCFWMGEATVKLRFTPSGETSHDLLLSSLPRPAENSPDRSVLDTLGYRFSLLQLMPYPTSENPQPDRPSTATIRVEYSGK